MNFENYKREIFDFEYFNSIAKQGFKERLGEPTELEATVGLISIAFNDLERKVSDAISKLLTLNGRIGKIVTSELSFKLKINLFSSLITELRKTHYFNRLNGEGFQENYQREFDKALNKCEELRNKVLHSVFIKPKVNGQIKYQRLKTTARAKHGLIEKTEDFEIYHLLNIYDFIVSMQIEIDDFFIDFKKNNYTKK
jgi:hypothetical protein